jgi:hypothetical protein
METRKSESEARKEKFAPCRVTPAKAGVHKVVGSCLRGNDRMGPFSNFEFRISSFAIPQNSYS